MKKIHKLIAKRLTAFLLCFMTVLCAVSCNTPLPPATEGESETAQTTGETTAPHPEESVSEPESETETETETETTEQEEPVLPEEIYEESFSAGYATVDVTPNYAVPLGGNGADLLRTTDHVYLPLYATCIAICDGTDTALLITVDVLNLSATFCDGVRNRLEKFLGVPAENIIINSSHTHFAPSAVSASGSAWQVFLFNSMLGLAREAIMDLAPAAVYHGQTRLEQMNFVRRYVLADGTYTGPNSGNDSKAEVVDHESKIDDNLQAILFKRENKLPIVAVNWRAHPCMTPDSKMISGDYVAALHMIMEKNGYLFSFFQGGSGNVNTFSLLDSEYYAYQRNKPVEYAYNLANALMEMIPNLSRTKVGKIQGSYTALNLKVDHSFDHMAEKAKELAAIRDEDFNLAKSLAKEYGFSSIHILGKIINNATRGEHFPVKVFALSFGEIAFATAPFEMFANTGVYIKENAPYAMTFACGYTNGSSGYLPSADAYPHGSYEVHTTYVAAGSAETVADALIDMLKKQKASLT